MNYSRQIPYSRLEEIRRFNQRIEETSDELEKEIYRKVKKVRIPYERLDMILKDNMDKIYALNKKEKRKQYIKLLFLSGSFVVIAIGIVIYTEP